MSWVSYYVCDWCGAHSENNIREDSFYADGWRKEDEGDLCKECVARRKEGLDALRKAARGNGKSEDGT